MLCTIIRLNRSKLSNEIVTRGANLTMTSHLHANFQASINQGVSRTQSTAKNINYDKGNDFNNGTLYTVEPRSYLTFVILIA